jgi:hypothetical protein
VNNDSWTLIISCSTQTEAELIRGMLLENGIESAIMNKRDSVYLFGEVEIYVPSEDALMALQLINASTHE